MEQLNQALQFLYDASRQARLTANDHKKLFEAATMLRENLDEQREVSENGILDKKGAEVEK